MAESTTNIDSGLQSASDYVLSSFMITTSDGKQIDLTKMINSFNLYEDIFTPFITGDVDVGDAMDIFNNFVIRGNEYVFIKLDKPSLDKPIERYFRIWKINNRNITSQSLQNYKIHFCSDEMILSSQMYMRKAYTGMTVDNMVKDILNKILVVSNDKMANGVFSSTSGNYSVVVPRMRPFEAASWLTSRAYNDSATLYFFFENRDGYNFASFEDLLKLPIYNTYSRSPKTTTAPDQNLNTFNFIRFVNEFDLLNGIRYGQFNVTLFSFDIIKRIFKYDEFSSLNLDKKSTLNGNVPINYAQDRFTNTMYDYPDATTKFLFKTDSDPNVPPTNPEKWLLPHALKLAQLTSAKVVINVPTDYMLKVGMCINLDIPKMQPQDQSYAQNKYSSGKYLITSVHHGITGDVSSTTLELMCDSLGEALPSAVNDSAIMQEVKNS